MPPASAQPDSPMPPAPEPRYRSRGWRAMKDRLFVVVCIAAALVSVAVLTLLLGSIAVQGLSHLDWSFLTRYPSATDAEAAGVLPALVGSILACAVCAMTAIPIGVATAVLLEEFRPKNSWLRKAHGFIQLNITNLAGVPSIVYGLLGLTLFVVVFGAFRDWEERDLPAIGRTWEWQYAAASGHLTFVPMIDPHAVEDWSNAGAEAPPLTADTRFKSLDRDPMAVRLIDSDELADREGEMFDAIAAVIDPMAELYDRLAAGDEAVTQTELDTAVSAGVADAELRSSPAEVRAMVARRFKGVDLSHKESFGPAYRYVERDLVAAERRIRFTQTLPDGQTVHELGADAYPSPAAFKAWYFIQLPLERSVLAGGLTLMLVVLPIVIIASQEALRGVPKSLRQASLAMGATPWQTVRRVTLPAALPGIMTGTILAMSRALGEAAPILVVAGGGYRSFLPENLMSQFSILPLQIYQWASLPQKEFQDVSATAIIVLLVVLLSFNAVAVFIRQRTQNKLA